MNKEMLEALNAPEFVVFDTETTALKTALAYGKIIEIGAVKVRNNEIVEEFSVFINPEMKIPKKIVELTHITDDMVKDAETIYPVLRKFKDFCGQSVLVAHNAPFDIRFLSFYLDQICMPMETDDVVLDTCKIDKYLFQDEASHKLEAIANRFGIIQESAHRAIDDARVTALAFIKMKELLQEEMTNYSYSYKCSKKHVDTSLLKYRNFGDFVKEGTKTRQPIDRLYISLYYPQDNIYGSIYYDRTRKEWYNKDFPTGYELDFKEIEEAILVLRKGRL